MTILNKAALFDFATLIRTAYPDAVLGFLGNSLGPSAVADRYLSETYRRAEQYIIPLSDNCLTLEAISKWPQFNDDYSYTVKNSCQYRCEEYIDVLKNSAVSPEKIISGPAKLVVLDRVVDATGLVSFGYLWSKAAREQGYDEEQISENLQLCPLPNQLQHYLSYTVVNKEYPQDSLSGKFARLNLNSASVNETTQVDDYWGNELRFSPMRSLKSTGKWSASNKYYEEIGKLYAQLADNTNDLVIVTDCPFLMDGDDDLNRKFQKKVAGLILE